MRKKTLFTRMIAVLVVVGTITGISMWYVGFFSFSPAASYDVNLETSLKDAASIPIGAAVDTYNLQNDPQYEELLSLHFNSIVAENEMKWKALEPEQGTYDFSHADYLIKYATSRGMQVHGHTLLWHQATPQWIENFEGTDAEFRARIKGHIQTVVGRYKGQVSSWDVVNEAFDGQAYRDTVYYRRLGANYLVDVYTWAHEADPSALLYYNDYNMLGDIDRVNWVMTEIRRLITAGAPIHGIGIQGHITLESPSVSSIKAALAGWDALELKIRISELDIQANYDGVYKVLTDRLANQQENRYKQVVAAFLTSPNLTGITLWGLYDGHTWIPYFQGHPDWPLLFNTQYEPKPAARGFLSAIIGENC